jgi:hypothetical protein
VREDSKEMEGNRPDDRSCRICIGIDVSGVGSGRKGEPQRWPTKSLSFITSSSRDDPCSVSCIHFSKTVKRGHIYESRYSCFCCSPHPGPFISGRWIFNGKVSPMETNQTFTRAGPKRWKAMEVTEFICVQGLMVGGVPQHDAEDKCTVMGSSRF